MNALTSPNIIDDTLKIDVLKKARKRGKWKWLDSIFSRPWSPRQIIVNRKLRKLFYYSGDQLRGEIDISGVIVKTAEERNRFCVIIVDSKDREIITFSCDNKNCSETVASYIKHVAANIDEELIPSQNQTHSDEFASGSTRNNTIQQAQMLLASGNIQEAKNLAVDYLNERFSSIESADMVTWYASLLLANGDDAVAQNYLTKALHSYNAGEINTESKRLFAINSIAMAARDSGKLDEAEELNRAAVSNSILTKGPQSGSTAMALSELGYVLYSRNKLVECREVLQRAKEIFQKCVPVASCQTDPLFPHYRNCLSNLSLVLIDLKEWQESEEIFVQLIPMKSKSLGVDHYDTLASKWHYSQVLLFRGLFAEAEKYCAEAMRGYIHSFGPIHEHTMDCIQTMIDILQKKMNYNSDVAVGEITSSATDESEWQTFFDSLPLPCLEKLLDCYSDNLKMVANILSSICSKKFVEQGCDSMEVLQYHHNLAVAYCQLEKFEEALDASKVAFTGRRRVLPEYHPHTVVSAKLFGSLCIRCQQYENALPVFTYLLQRNSQVLGDEDNETIESRHVVDYLQLYLESQS